QHRPSSICRRLGHGPDLVVHSGAHGWSCAGFTGLPGNEALGKVNIQLAGWVTEEERSSSRRPFSERALSSGVPGTRAPSLPGVGKLGWRCARFSRAGLVISARVSGSPSGPVLHAWGGSRPEGTLCSSRPLSPRAKTQGPSLLFRY